MELMEWSLSTWEIGMEADVREQVIELLAGELDGIDNLDDLERRAVSLMRDLAQGVVQRKLDDKKGATGDRASAVRAGPRPGSSAIAARPS